MKNDDRFFMRCAIELAKKGAGFVSPNPLVGCIMTKNGKVVSEGWHKKFGSLHAEAAAMKGRIVRGATVYVNLEPCTAHPGKKTPPCADALIAAGVKRVVIGMKDPNPHVAGRGIRKLRAAGIEVQVGVLRQECEELNEVFANWITMRKPFVVLKSAITLDGAMTLRSGTQSSLSSAASNARVHGLRQLYDVIAVGVNTVLIDNSRLTVRKSGKTRNPVRVVFDTHFRIPEDAKMFSESGKTIVFVGPEFDHPKKKKLEDKYERVEVVSMPVDKSGHISMSAALNYLGEVGVASVLVEGGADVAKSFLRENLLHKLIVIFTPKFSHDLEAPRLFSTNLNTVNFQSVRWEPVGDDVWFIGKVK